MSKHTLNVLSLVLSAVLVSPAAGCPNVAFCDDFARPTFDAAANGWNIQSYPKGKGVFGRIPGMIDNGNKARFAVRVYPDSSVQMTSVATIDPFTPVDGSNPSAYLEFSASVKLNWSTANTDGLVFAISAFGSDSNGSDAVNFEFVTKQINEGSNGVAYDRLLLTSFQDYDSTVNDNRWYSYVESGINSTDNYHVYMMKVYADKVVYLVDGITIATYNGPYVPDNDLYFVLNAWAPDSSWGTAEGPLPDDSYYYMDVDWAKVAYRSTSQPIPEPGSLALLSCISLLIMSRRNRSEGCRPDGAGDAG